MASPSETLNRRAVLAGIGALAAGAVTTRSSGATSTTPALARLARGFNIPDWLEREGGLAPAPVVLTGLRAAGFTAVRLPVNGDRFAFGDATSRATATNEVEAALSLLLDHDFAVMLDLHTSPELSSLIESDPAAGADAAVAAWEQLAPIATGYGTDQVFPELLNEPPLERRNWVKLRDRLAKAVRHACPDHTTIWGAARVQGIWETLEQPALDDANAIAAVHYYWPMGFTHQCQNWSESPLERLAWLPFPAERDDPAVEARRALLEADDDREALAVLDEEFSSPWGREQIERDFADLARWSEATGTPAIVNEFGVLNFCVDPKSRATWTRAVRETAEAHGFGWTHWDLDQGFGFLASRLQAAGFDDAMLEALLA